MLVILKGQKVKTKVDYYTPHTTQIFYVKKFGCEA